MGRETKKLPKLKIEIFEEWYKQYHKDEDYPLFWDIMDDILSWVIEPALSTIVGGIPYSAVTVLGVITFTWGSTISIFSPIQGKVTTIAPSSIALSDDPCILYVEQDAIREGGGTTMKSGKPSNSEDKLEWFILGGVANGTVYFQDFSG